MEEAVQISAVCVLGALLALFLKKGTPEIALLTAIAVSVAVFLFLREPLAETIGFLRELSEQAGVRQELLIPLYKTVGIAAVVKIGGNLCRDAEEGALASVIETAGALCAFVVALPLLRTALSVLVELMKS